VITTNIRLFLCFTLALMLTIMPLPVVLEPFRPQWVLLLMLYVQFYLPACFRISLVFLVGLSVDLLLSTVIGEHAFALLLTAWVACGRTRRFKFLSTLQQMFLIIIFCMIEQGVIFVVEAFQGYSVTILDGFGTVLSSMFFWPLVKWLLDRPSGCGVGVIR